ncbi:MAG TPA: hypothetical protein VFX16_11055 [Pseudonocardiaceae bacterium]|nr:hypothetical protein [Pseudonocardiaceae bacterium]
MDSVPTWWQSRFVPRKSRSAGKLNTPSVIWLLAGVVIVPAVALGIVVAVVVGSLALTVLVPVLPGGASGHLRTAKQQAFDPIIALNTGIDQYDAALWLMTAPAS